MSTHVRSSISFIQHMRQIKVQEAERENGDWKKLPPKQLRDKEAALQHLGLMGRHRNILANYTIYTLETITRNIKTIFCHDIMVERVAGMLNYFLKHLVSKISIYHIQPNRCNVCINFQNPKESMMSVRVG